MDLTKITPEHKPTAPVWLVLTKEQLHKEHLTHAVVVQSAFKVFTPSIKTIWAPNAHVTDEFIVLMSFVACFFNMFTRKKRRKFVKFVTSYVSYGRIVFEEPRWLSSVWHHWMCLKRPRDNSRRLVYTNSGVLMGSRAVSGCVYIYNNCFFLTFPAVFLSTILWSFWWEVRPNQLCSRWQSRVILRRELSKSTAEYWATKNWYFERDLRKYPAPSKRHLPWYFKLKHDVFRTLTKFFCA